MEPKETTISVHSAAAAGQVETSGEEIRRCDSGDSDALSQIGAATFLETYAGWLPGKDILAHCRLHHSSAAYEELLSQADTSAWVAERKDAPVGYVLLSKPDFPEELLRPGDTDLKRIYLFSKFHGTGLAGRLLEQAILQARVAGKRRMLVGLHPENRKAFAFYSKQGFREVGKRLFKMGSTWCEDPVMALPL